MRYWPLWMVIESPTLSPAHAAELQRINNQAPSEAAYYAAFAATQGIPAMEAPNLVIVTSKGTPSRRVFIGYPQNTEWLRLERTCVMDDGDQMLIHTDALH